MTANHGKVVGDPGFPEEQLRQNRRWVAETLSIPCVV
jgi:hypothetical protein